MPPHNVPTAVTNPALVSEEVAPASMKGTLSVVDERTGKEYKVEVSPEGTIKATDFRKISLGNNNDDGLIVYDPGSMNTSPIRTSICYIDGIEGILRYRGYPIEDLIHKSTYMEVSYLIIYGNLPSENQLLDWEHAISQNSAVPQAVLDLIQSMPDDAHPMSMLSSAMSALSVFHPDANTSFKVIK
ncbi:Citrate synthase 3, peroxisomal [Stylosanthes scabra]|uniref:Citrate synthase 3, peroxisomal n=1 Tax=Stylosanthes scabra TaxID=79078 RepID=A0ABU6TZ07_9FABA|nr:Citrate synthase 3, peroxisomal [Stylosanthes scabra]